MSTIFFDVDTQIDFLYPAGALYVPGAEKLVDIIARLNQYASNHGHLVISTTDAHTEDDPEFRNWPPHCVRDTFGQLKPQSTLLGKRTSLPSSRVNVHIGDAQQLLLEKQTLDCFSNENLPELLKADAYVVYGVVTEICVKYASCGLLKTGKPVTLVTDAVMHLDPAARDAMIAEFTSQGGNLATSEQILNAG